MGYLAQEMEGLTRLDEDLLIAVISLYRKDLAEAKKSGKASGKTDSITGDDLTSIELYLNELESALTFEKDHRLAQSIVQAKLTDFHAIDEIVRAEQQDYEDRQLALRLAGRTGGAIDNNAAANRPPTSYDEVIGQTTPLLSKLAGLWVSEDAGRALHPDNKQGYVDLEPEFDEALATKMDCAVCGDSKSFFELVEVSCKHMYCKGCIQELFNLSYHDESLFPPRCCSKSIKVADVSIFLTKKLIAQFDEKDIEFKTVDKTYCANKECLKFVLPGTLSNGIGHCQKCDTNTCAFCKNEAHVGTDCPSDPSLKAVLDLAEEEGWKRCDRCKSMVELRIGCYHITCRWYVFVHLKISCCLLTATVDMDFATSVV